MQRLITGQSAENRRLSSTQFSTKAQEHSGRRAEKMQEAEDWVGGCEPVSSGQDRATAPMNLHSCGYLHEAYTSLSLSQFHSAWGRGSPGPHSLEEFPIVDG